MARSRLLGRSARIFLGCLALSLVPDKAIAQSAPRPYGASVELKAMFDADQADRRSGRLAPHHERARLDRVRQMVMIGQLASADDYYHAAMILQHSNESRDHLLAHALATAAAFRGHQAARWLSAATLDRFLEWTGQKQFFGTQYTRNDAGALVPGPFDQHLTETLREDFGVPPVAEMLRRATEWNRVRRP